MRYWAPKREYFIREAKRKSEDPNFIEGYALGAEIGRLRFPARLLGWAETKEKPVIVAVGRDAIPLLKTLFIERRLQKSTVPLEFIGISGEHPAVRDLRRAVLEFRGTEITDLIREYGSFVPKLAGRGRYRATKSAKNDLLWELLEIERSAGLEGSESIARSVENIIRKHGGKNVILVDWAHVGTHPIILSLGLRRLGWPLERIHTAMALAEEPANRIHEVVGGVIERGDRKAKQAANISEFTPKIMGPFAEVNRPVEIRKENMPAWREFIRGVEKGYREWRAKRVK